MEDLTQPQIRQNCHLALPEGLQDLMSDISREVLRAQPKDLYQFITDYLSALLVARENLYVAAQVCNDVCKTHCYPELEDELRELGLSDEDVEKAVEVITEHLERGDVQESNLLQKLLKKTNVNEEQLSEVLAVVRAAFLRHQVNNTVIYESSTTDSDLDETLLAAKHTLKLYKKTKAPGENFEHVVDRIKTAYRAHDIRRKFQHADEDRPPKEKKTPEKKSLRFEPKMDQPFPDSKRSKRCSSKASSLSLAGSFVTLPPYKPYSIDDHSDIEEVDEVTEKEREHNSFDYTSEAPPQSSKFIGVNIEKKVEDVMKTISHRDFPKPPLIVVFQSTTDGDIENEAEDIEEVIAADENEVPKEIDVEVNVEELEIMEKVSEYEDYDDTDVLKVRESKSSVGSNSVQSLDDDTESSDDY